MKWDILNNSRRKNIPIMCGFKGHTFWETGYVYAPYTPLLETELRIREPLLQEGSWLPREFLSRYATIQIKPEFFGVINLNKN